MTPRSLSAARNAGWLAAALVGAGSPAAASDLDGRAIVGYRAWDADATSSEALTQLYELRLQHEVSSALRYRLALRSESELGEGATGRDDYRLQHGQLQPFADLLYAIPAVQLQAHYDVLWADGRGSSGQTTDRRLQRGYGRLAAAIDDGAWLSVLAERRVAEDFETGLQTNETILRGALDYTTRRLTLVPAATYNRYEDLGLPFRRDVYTVQGLGDYHDTFWDGRLGVVATAGVTSTLAQEQTLSTTPVLAPLVVTPVAALGGIDDTPLDGTDSRLSPAPALLDGDVATSAGVDLGPGAPSFQSLAVDMGRFVALDELRIYVRTSEGAPVLYERGISWSIYASADGLLWTVVDPSAPANFQTTLSRFEVQLTSTLSRFFKAVSFGGNTTDTVVTELEAVTHELLEPMAERETRTALGSGTVVLSYRPIQPLTLQYDGAVNAVRQRPRGRASRTSVDWDQAVGATMRSTDAVTWGVRYERRNVTQTGGFAQRYESVSGLVQIAPYRELQSALSVQHFVQDDDGALSTSQGASLRGYALLYPEVDVALDVGFTRQRWTEPFEQRVDRWIVSGVGTAQIITSLKVSALVTVQASDYAGSLTDSVVPVYGHDERYAAELYYRPSSQLALAARLGYAFGPLIEGPIQRYRVDWSPFAAGTVSLGFAYDEDVEGRTGHYSRRLSVFPRWVITRNAVLDTSYSRFVTDGARRSSTEIFFATLTLST